MAQLNIRIPEEKLEALRKYARRRRTHASWLIRDYIDYLTAGGEPISLADDTTAWDTARISQFGGSFDWLRDEPDIYTDEDGEPYGPRS